jgi:pyruvate dehydrogenase E2 component (dihydrolipoamide acetyltransferase)
LSLAGQVVPATPMRAAIARRMTESKQQAPHFYVSTEVEMDAVAALIADVNAGEPGVRVTATAALVRACAVALERHPRVNSVWTADGLLQADAINIGVAVALDDGLIAPALVGAGDLDLTATASALADLVERARAKKLKPAELSDATFTLSNLGMFDVSSFSAIVTPPQVAILATGRSARRVLPAEDGTRSASVMTATLSVDHRALDGTDAAGFLQTFKGALEAPDGLLRTDGQREETKA